MRKTLPLLLSFFFIAAGAMAQTPAKPLLRHVVLIKFKDGSSADTIKKIESAFRLLPARIKLIKDFEWGVNNSPEKLNQGHTHCFFLSFADEKDRDAYLVHPDHQVFVGIAGPHIEKVTVVDYWLHR